MRILVTGGSGFLGTHVRRHFDADDLSRRSGKNILNLQDVAVVNEYDVVIHLAAHLDKSEEGAGETFLTNVEGTVNVLREMRRDAIFIFASTKDVYGRFADSYQAVPETCPTVYSGQSALEWSKLIAERYVEFYAGKRGFRSCIFRLSTVYAPISDGNTPNFVGHFVDAVNTGEPIPLPGGGTARRDLLHVDDFSTACTAFIDSVINHGLYNLGGGLNNAVSMRELAHIIGEVSGYQAVIADHPAPAPVPLNYVSDIALIDQELGWRPKISVREGLASLFKR